jgi:hypothetical protein
VASCPVIGQDRSARVRTCSEFLLRDYDTEGLCEYPQSHPEYTSPPRLPDAFGFVCKDEHEMGVLCGSELTRDFRDGGLVSGALEQIRQFESEMKVCKALEVVRDACSNALIVELLIYVKKLFISVVLELVPSNAISGQYPFGFVKFRGPMGFLIMNQSRESVGT